MYMSDHQCKESLKSYCRRPSKELKHTISAVLENVTAGFATSQILLCHLKNTQVQGLTIQTCYLLKLFRLSLSLNFDFGDSFFRGFIVRDS